MPKGNSLPKRHGGSSDKPITDPRFSSFQTDPRYRLPSKAQTRTTLDKRFAHALRDNDFTATSRVDRYGRKVRSDTKKKALERLYQEEQDVAEDDEEEDDDEELVRRELRNANAKHDPARGGGFSDSDSESGSDDEAGDLAEEDDDVGAELQPFQAEVEVGEVTRRLAVVNLDWDHIKSVDLMALFSSFLPSGGRINRVSIYPSQFGKERMEREEMEGPPKEIFKATALGEDEPPEENDNDLDDDSSAEDSDEEIKKELIKEEVDQDFDSNALRTYQLDRLRYFYAVVVCSDLAAAQKIYDAVDGTEYLSSSNFLDLRFIPDDVKFDEDEPRDECDSVPNDYRPVDFVTEALQSSKVKLTWDMDPDELTRKESIRKVFSGSRADIAENDLKAYLASDSEDEAEQLVGGKGEEPALTKKELARRKMREALGLSNEASKKASKSDAATDMEITFTPALMEGSAAKSKKDSEEETTIEKYMRKERERKERKREQHKAKRDDVDDSKAQEAPNGHEEKGDLGFDDPFFTTEPEKPSKPAVRKEERRKKREGMELEAEKSKAQKAQLELLMTDNTDGAAAHLDHFDMSEIVRAEKQKKKKKGKKAKKDQQEQGGDLQQDFDMDVGDSRFKAVFEDHEFAIDPSNPRFKATESMKRLLEEGRKRKHDREGIDDDRAHSKRASKKNKADRR